MITSRNNASFHQKTTLTKSQAGFSIVELMVTLSIVVLATGLVMIKYASFNSSVLLNSLAYQIAFDVREAQSLGISVRGRGDQFKEEYGLYFDMTDLNQYLLFQDDGDTKPARYDIDEEIGEPNIIDPRFTIVDMCATKKGETTEYCHSSGGVPDNISIAFSRPDFNAVLYNKSDLLELKEAKIYVGPGDGSGNKRAIVVTHGGMISVK